MNPIRYGKGLTNISSAENSRFLTTDQNNQTKIWNSINDIECAVQLNNQITALAFRNNKIYVAKNIMELKAYDFQKKEDLGVLFLFNAQIQILSVNESNTLVYTSLANNQIQVMDIKAKKITNTLCHDKKILQICLDPLEKYFAVLFCNETVKIWTQKNFQNVQIFMNEQKIVNNKEFWKIYWHKSGNIIALPSNNQVNFYERSTWQKKFSIKIFDNIESNVSFCEFSPDITKVLTGNCGQIVLFIR